MMKRKIYDSECLNCRHRAGVHFVVIPGISSKGAKDSCNGYVRKDQPNYDGKSCGCKRYLRPQRKAV